MTQDQDKRPRAAREETIDAILDAAERLFSERGYSAATVREIAKAAGVSHALVHRYLGSKEQVYRAVLQRSESTIRDAALEQLDLLGATSAMLREALRQRQYVRLVAHSALHGLPYERTVGRFAATERLAELAQATADADKNEPDPGAPDPRFVVASLVAMLLGWSAAGDWVLRAVGLQDLSDDEFAEQFERVVLDLERLYFPSLRDSGG